VRRGATACAWLAAAIIAGCAVEPARRQPATERPKTLTSYGIVSDGGTIGSEIWFELSKIDQRFVFDTGRTADVSALTGILDASSNTARSLHVTFDLASAAFDIGLDKPTYVVRAIEYDGRTVAGMVGPRRSSLAPSRAEAALARGIAYANGGDHAYALPELDAALDGDRLAARLRPLAYETRGKARVEGMVAAGGGVSRANDRALIAALADYRAWAALEPGESDPKFKIAGTLADLGAYDQAIAVYDTIPTDDPDDAYWVALMKGATYRTARDFDRALAALDALAAQGEAPVGMAYHYHRGWTLYELGRDEESIAELTAGIADQPDYFGAFIQRACAYARLGRHQLAIDDRRQANAEIAGMWKGDDSPPAWAKREIATGDRLIAALEAAIASGRKKPVAAPCVSEHYFESKRRRSRLLKG